MSHSKYPTKYTFNGAFDLDNVDGIIYEDYTQTGALVLSVSSGKAKGSALVQITANGDAITVPAGWILYGGDEISIVDGDVNHVSVIYIDADTVYYTNKVV